MVLARTPYIFVLTGIQMPLGSGDKQGENPRQDLKTKSTPRMQALDTGIDALDRITLGIMRKTGDK